MKTKRKLLIVNNNMATGGVQSALVNLLHEAKEKYDITLYLFSVTGDYVINIPEEVAVIKAPKMIELLGVSQSQSMSMGFFNYLIRAYCVIFSKIFTHHIPIALLLKAQRKMKGFDVAISYLHNSPSTTFYGGCNEFVLQCVEAKHKITFIHCDYQKYGGHSKYNKKQYEQFDRIVAVSEGCKESFLEKMPHLKSKTVVVYNAHQFGKYRKLSCEEPYAFQADYTNFVTVARLSPEKGIKRCMRVFEQCMAIDKKIRWYIVGDGAEKEDIVQLIADKGYSNHIILLGNQKNPYRYMKHADIFLLPSYHEAAPMVFHEAKSLGIPIITTETISARELIQDGVEGMICNNSERGLYEGIRTVLQEPSLIETMKKNLSLRKYDNSTAMRQFENLLEGEGANHGSEPL